MWNAFLKIALRQDKNSHYSANHTCRSACLQTTIFKDVLFLNNVISPRRTADRKLQTTLWFLWKSVGDHKQFGRPQLLLAIVLPGVALSRPILDLKVLATCFLFIIFTTVSIFIFDFNYYKDILQCLKNARKPKWVCIGINIGSYVMFSNEIITMFKRNRQILITLGP